MTDYRRLIDTQTQGPRNDVTPLFTDYPAFIALLDDLIAPFARTRYDLVAGIDALGFILGTAVAVRARKGFLPLRKGGKLPVKTDTAYFVDYSGHPKSLELRPDAIPPGARVLVVDEWIETGAQVKAAIELIERQGGVVVGVATIGMNDNESTRMLAEQYNAHAVLTADNL
jgi:adenine phosphoribosyltransferase